MEIDIRLLLQSLKSVLNGCLTRLLEVLEVPTYSPSCDNGKVGGTDSFKGFNLWKYQGRTPQNIKLTALNITNLVSVRKAPIMIKKYVVSTNNVLKNTQNTLKNT